MKSQNAVVGTRVVVKDSYNYNFTLVSEVGTVVFYDGYNGSLLIQFDDAFEDGHDGNTNKFKGENGKCWWILPKYLKKLKQTLGW